MPTKIGEITLYTVQEISEAMEGKVSKDTLRAYIKDGKLKGRKVGGTWWITEESLRDFFGAVPSIRGAEKT